MTDLSQLPDDLALLETRLRGLVPASGRTRDEYLFELGRASAAATSNGLRLAAKLWMGGCGIATAVAIVLGSLWMADATEAPRVIRETHTIYMSPSREDESKAVLVDSARTSPESVGDPRAGAADHSLPRVLPGQETYLSTRRVAVTQGVDALPAVGTTAWLTSAITHRSSEELLQELGGPLREPESDLRESTFSIWEHL